MHDCASIFRFISSGRVPSGFAGSESMQMMPTWFPRGLSRRLTPPPHNSGVSAVFSPPQYPWHLALPPKRQRVQVQTQELSQMTFLCLFGPVAEGKTEAPRRDPAQGWPSSKTESKSPQGVFPLVMAVLLCGSSGRATQSVFTECPLCRVLL